jgi:nuclease-like protein
MSLVDLFIGDLVEHGSDRMVLEHVATCLQAANTPAVVFANIYVGGRQVDLVVATDRSVLVLENKSVTGPVSGSGNGDWKVQTASGRWKKIRNPYLQTVNAGLALRDAMRAFSGEEPRYPAAALIFAPDIPNGSSIPAGDYRASIGGLDAIAGLLQRGSGDSWPLERWRDFARHCGFMPMGSVRAAIDPRLFEAERVLEAYSEAFREFYGPLASAMVSVSCRYGEDTASCASGDAVERAVTVPGVLVTGPSGCAKTLLGYSMAVAAVDRGDIPVVIAAKNFQGRLADAANREVTLLGASSAREILSACRKLGRRLMMVIDGYNECAAAERAQLTRSIAAVSHRYGAQIVITSQAELERPELVQLLRIAVVRPDRATKQAIAAQGGGEAVPERLDALLESVDSGLEARLVGIAGQGLSGVSSRFAIFDRYVRMRLGSDASAGVTALSRVAGLMIDRVRFSVSVRELDRLADRERIAPALLERLKSVNLLEVRGDRVSFGHELFMNALIAEAIVRRAAGDAAVIATALVSPRHANHRALILGAVEDDRLTRRVLADCSDTVVVRACLDGQCGLAAREWAEEKCAEVLKRAGKEIDQLAFMISDGSFLDIETKPETVFDWSAQESAVLAVLPEQLSQGRFLDEVLELSAKADRLLSREHARLREEARARKVALRSGLFGACYVPSTSDGPAIARICGPIHRGMLYTAREVAEGLELRAWLARGGLSSGQLFLLLMLHRHSRRDAQPIADLLPGIVNAYWPGAAYYLRLRLIEAVQDSGLRAGDADRARLIEVLEGLLPLENVMLSTAAVDALKFLGGLVKDEDEHLTVVEGNIQHALQDENDPERQHLAVSLWNCQFDHPYDGAYCQAWNELSPEDRRKLLVMAARAIDLDSWFASFLLASLASLADPALAPLIARWTALPPTRCAMPGDAIQTFAMAHAAFGRLGSPLPWRTGSDLSAAQAALVACAECIYWLNRIDLAMPARKAACREPLAVLSRHGDGVAAAVVGLFKLTDLAFSEIARQLPGSEPVLASLLHAFPAEMVEVFRKALAEPARQKGYFDGFRPMDLLGDCLHALGDYGTSADIELLGRYSIVPGLGTIAVDAIRRLEGVRADVVNVLARRS